MASQAPNGSQAINASVEPGDWDAVSVQTSEAQTRQFVTLYEALQDFDDSQAPVPRDLPRLCFAGSADQINYGPGWGEVQVRIGEPLAAHEGGLITSGWDVLVLPGLDHMSTMHSNVVLPLLHDWLRKVEREK
ncbi:hypothetical protein [Pseudarthrobacter sp. S9]|uniref:hypothetical protein n=1 Tax=Pseudarthrobacter sp. S9 TaxID=3418421 RepID=UPI003CFEC025